MKSSEVLTAAKGLIDTPEKWCKGFFKVSGEGVPTRHCAYGSVLGAQGQLECAGLIGGVWESSKKAYNIEEVYDTSYVPRLGTNLKEQVYRYLEAAIPENYDQRLYMRSIAGYNNDPKTKHSDVMAWFDRAIGLARGDEEKEEAKALWQDLVAAPPVAEVAPVVTTGKEEVKVC